MSAPRIPSRVTAPTIPAVQPSAASATAAAAPSHVDAANSDGFQAHKAAATTAAAAPPKTSWWAGRPLSEGINAHKTNTKEQFSAGLHSDANWFEGDVRQELNTSGMEMRHDTTQESGDNLTLREWLKAGIASGRGLKLDVKEPEHMQQVLDDVRSSGAPQDRLMFNLSFSGMEQWGAKIHAEYPNAIIAINPPVSGKVDAAAAQKMVDQANRIGGQATFVVRHNLLTDEAIAIFKQRGTVSVWGADVKDIPAERASLLQRGVNGMIDLGYEPPPGVKDIAEKGWNWAKTVFGKIT